MIVRVHMLKTAVTSFLLLSSATSYAAEIPEIIGVIRSDTENTLFGSQIVPLGDQNNDGYADLPGVTFPSTIKEANTFSQRCHLRFTFTGQPFDLLGTSVSGGGDVNNDGFDDVVVGLLVGGDDNQGQAVVYSGLDGDTIHIFTGRANEDWFGNSVAIAGDVDGDGYADVLVGAPHSDVNGVNSGSAYVFSGRTGETLFVFHGEMPGDWFGVSVASAGDINSDGHSDVIVGAWLNDSAGDDAGRAYVFSGKDGSTSYVFDGTGSFSRFGRIVAGGGDVNNDGFDDVMSVGGDLFVFSGFDGDTLHRFSPGRVLSAAIAGDVNSDGFDDIIIGAVYTKDSLGATFRLGRSYVHSGASGDTLHVMTGRWPGSPSSVGPSFGVSVSGIGDANGDGFDDFIVGAWTDDPDLDLTGRAFVFSGLDGDTIAELEGESQGDAFGIQVSGAGDVNGDGFADVIVGADFSSAGGIASGRAYLFTCFDVMTDVGPNDEANLPANSSLEQNYPNPFNPETTIEFSLKRKRNVELIVYNLLGRQVKQLINQTLSAGSYKLNWDGTNQSGRSVASGVYYYQLKTDNTAQSKKMLLLK